MKSIALALALCLPLAAAAAEGPTRATKPKLQANVPDYNLDTRVYYLRSGLTLMFQADHSHPIVSIMSIVDHGSSDDPKGKEGTAHFCEHAWFRSTQTIVTGFDEQGQEVTHTLPSIMDTLQDYGTLMNATTRKDWTDFRTVFSAEHLDMFLQLESNRLTDPYVGVTEEHVDTEREVIRNEWRRRNENGVNMLFDHLFASVYDEHHPYHASSTKESLGRIDLKTLQTYFDDYYKPENTTIAIVGDFDLDETTSLIYKNFAPELIDPAMTKQHIFKYPAPGVTDPKVSNRDDWWFGAFDPATYDPKKPADEQDLYRMLNPSIPAEQKIIADRVRIKPDSPRDPVPDPGTREVIYKEAPIDNRTVLVAWSLPGAFREDHLALSMVGGFANFATNMYFLDPINFQRHEESWRANDLGDVGCFAQPQKINTTVMCMVEIKNKKLNPEQIGEKIIDQMPTIWNPDMVLTLRDRTMPRTQQQMLADTLQSIDKVAYHFGGRAEDIVTYGHYTGQPTYHSYTMNQAMQLTAHQVSDIAQKYLTRKRAVIVVVDPLPEDEIEKTGEGSTWAGASDGDSLLEGGSWLDAITDEDIKNAYVTPDVSKIVDTKLPNGLRVIALPHGEAPVAYTGLVTGGGRLSGEPMRVMLQEYFSRADVINRSGSTFGKGDDPLSIAGQTYGELNSDFTVTGLQHASGNVDGAMWLLREEMERAKPDTEGKRGYVKGRKKRLEGRWGGSSPGWLIGEYRQKHIFGADSPMMPSGWDDWTKFDGWGNTEISQTLADRYQPENTTLVVTGRIDSQETLDLAKKYFGGWTARPGATKDIAKIRAIPETTGETASKILVFDSPERTQTQVGGYCRLNYEGRDQLPAVKVLSSLIGNEVFTRLRVKEALAYSPGGYATVTGGGPDQGVGMLGFSSLAVNDGVGRTVEVMTGLVKTAEKSEFDDSLIKMHKLRQARQSGIEQQSTLQMGTRLESIAAGNQPIEALLNPGERIAAVDKAQITALVDGCSDRLLFTLNGPKEVITPQLDKLGFEYEIIDWKAEGESRFEKRDPKGFKKYLKKKAKREKAKEKEKAKKKEEK